MSPRPHPMLLAGATASLIIATVAVYGAGRPGVVIAATVLLLVGLVVSLPRAFLFCQRQVDRRRQRRRDKDLAEFKALPRREQVRQALIRMALGKTDKEKDEEILREYGEYLKKSDRSSS